MSFLDNLTENVFNEAEKAFGEGSNLPINFLDNASNKMIDSMKSLPGNMELQNLGFPQFEELLKPDNTHCPSEGAYQQMDFSEFMNKLFGDEGSPWLDTLGGQGGFDQTLRSAFDLLSNDPENLLRQLGIILRDNESGGLFGDLFSGVNGFLGGGEKGLGGILGGILGGSSGGILGGILGGGGGGGILGGILGGGGGGGILGGILGGGGGGILDKIIGEIPGAETLLPIALKVAPLLL